MTGPSTGSSLVAEPRERFLKAIVEHVTAARLVEVHLFAPMRQGGRETGVAVVAARPEDAGVGSGERAGEGAGAPPELHDSPARAPDSHPTDALDTDSPPPRATEPRLTIYRAHYRLTRKGPDRGRWEMAITAEADAPLRAVDEVVRGVHRRAGEEAEPERLSAEAVMRELTQPWAVRH